MPDWEVIVVDQEGTPYGSAADAVVTRLSWELNRPGTAEVSLPTTHPDAALFVPGREVQIYWDSDLIWWGTIVRPQGGLVESTWQCAGLLWYFAHRYMGTADRVNQLTNGGFESGSTGWTFEGGVTHSIDATFHFESAHSLKLSGATADHNSYASQVWTHPAGGHPLGDLMTASAWVYVPSAAYVGGAVQDRGLFLIRRNPAGVVIQVGEGTPKIDDNLPKDQWVQIRAAVPGVPEGETVEVRLYPPHGDAYYDAVVLVYMESLSFGYPGGTDVANVVEGLVLYAQDRGAFTHGKSDLNIDTDVPDTTVTKQIAYQFAEHRNIEDAILEYVRNGNLDIDIELTPTTRTFTGYVPQKGTTYGTTLELDTNVADFTWAWDGEQGASSVVLLGPGDGPDRPEGGAVDAGFVGGAYTSEIVESASDDVSIGQLDDRAADRLAAAVQPTILSVTTLPGAGVIGDLKVGDNVPVLISWGWVDIDATYRAVRIEADLLKDQATITFNPVP